MKLYYSPLSSYSQKTLMAFHEKGVAFEPKVVHFTPEGRAEYKKVYKLGKVPLLVLDDGWMVPESSIIIEWLETHHAGVGTQLIPSDPEKARQVRFHDRVADLYLNDTMTTLFFDGRKPQADREPKRVARAEEIIDITYEFLDHALSKRTWIAGEEFSMADCAMAPPLSALRMLRPFTAHKHITSYFGRLAERPSFQKVRAEAEPALAAFMAAGK